MMKRIVRYIENEPWEAELLKKEKRWKAACWAVIIIAALYFGPRCLAALMR
ncbi:MAG: hypothetical protein NTV58_12175 [Deltaproteobacteria bacterium]|nr:hypothetical protein [Deltaproteobacteria bacterium]